MAIKIGLFLSDDSDEFPERAAAWSTQSGAVCFPVHQGQDMVAPAANLPPRSVEQLSVFAHGTTCALGKPGRFGVDLRPARQLREGVLSPDEFTAAWGPVLTQGALVSLAACLCARSQHWYLQGRFGKVAATYASPWGQESYESGGATSLAARLVSSFSREGVTVHVRGHCAAGHCTRQALLRDFAPGRNGLSLFRLVLGTNLKWTRKARNLWQSVVKGQLAERWLLGDDTVDHEIRERLAPILGLR